MIYHHRHLYNTPLAGRSYCPAPLRQIKKTSSNTNQTVIVATSRSRNIIRTLVTVFGTLIQTDTLRSLFFLPCKWWRNDDRNTITTLCSNSTTIFHSAMRSGCQFYFQPPVPSTTLHTFKFWVVLTHYMSSVHIAVLTHCAGLCAPYSSTSTTTATDHPVI
jgi:hypothetical protein